MTLRKAVYTQNVNQSQKKLQKPYNSSEHYFDWLINEDDLTTAGCMKTSLA